MKNLKKTLAAVALTVGVYSGAANGQKIPGCDGEERDALCPPETTQPVINNTANSSSNSGVDNSGNSSSNSGVDNSGNSSSNSGVDNSGNSTSSSQSGLTNSGNSTSSSQSGLSNSGNSSNSNVNGASADGSGNSTVSVNDNSSFIAGATATPADLTMFAAKQCADEFGISATYGDVAGQYGSFTIGYSPAEGVDLTNKDGVTISVVEYGSLPYGQKADYTHNLDEDEREVLNCVLTRYDSLKMTWDKSVEMANVAGAHAAMREQISQQGMNRRKAIEGLNRTNEIQKLHVCNQAVQYETTLRYEGEVVIEQKTIHSETLAQNNRAKYPDHAEHCFDIEDAKAVRDIATQKIEVPRANQFLINLGPAQQ